MKICQECGKGIEGEYGSRSCDKVKFLPIRLNKKYTCIDCDEKHTTDINS